MTTRSTTFGTVFIALALAAAAWMLAPAVDARQGAWPVGLANYRDVAELDARLVQLADSSSHAQLYTIGSSIDYHTNPDAWRTYRIRAIRISESTNERIGDDIRKNSILFEAGSHPREWLSTESALALAEYLVNNAENERTEVPELLRGADVWIVPLTTVAGRAIDDTAGGDPRSFSTRPDARGWRGNGDTRGCNYGVNVARNFSAGWNRAPSIDCIDDDEGTAQDPVDGENNDHPRDYRGFAPFSTLEAAALRQFVQNHSISMAVVMHSNLQQIWNRWGNADLGGTVIANRAMAAFNTRPAESLGLTRASLGGGRGQFSAWLAADSDERGQPDEGTTRRIQTVFVELPINDYGDAPKFENTGESNGFHPSHAPTVRTLRLAAIDMGLSLIRDAKSPGCIIAAADAPADQQDGCPGQDFGLVGAKIAPSHTAAGLISTYGAVCFGGETAEGCPGVTLPARDVLRTGTYAIYYRVQNFGRDAANDAVDVRLSLDSVQHLPEGDIASTTTRTTRSHTLSTQQAGWGVFLVNFPLPDTDYTMTLEIRPRAGSFDRFTSNNKKVFRVTTQPDGPE